MVILGKVGICGAGLLDPLVAISHGGEGYGPIGLERELPVAPVEDDGDTFWARTCTRERAGSVSGGKTRRWSVGRVRTISRHPVSQNFEPSRVFITTNDPQHLGLLEKPGRNRRTTNKRRLYS